MNIRWLGALLVIAGCGGAGYSLAAAHRRQEEMLRQLMGAIEYMSCELEYRLTPLPELCIRAGQRGKGYVKRVLLSMGRELDRRICPDPAECMRCVLEMQEPVSKLCRRLYIQLGNTLGQFDLSGQRKGLDSLFRECGRELEELTKDRENRLRSYQTLGLCAGAALAILFI